MPLEVLSNVSSGASFAADKTSQIPIIGDALQDVADSTKLLSIGRYGNIEDISENSKKFYGIKIFNSSLDSAILHKQIIHKVKSNKDVGEEEKPKPIKSSKKVENLDNTFHNYAKTVGKGIADFPSKLYLLRSFIKGGEGPGEFSEFIINKRTGEKNVTKKRIYEMGIVGYPQQGTFTQNIQSQWMALSGGNGPSSAVKGILSTLGISAYHRLYNFKIWDGTEPLSFNIPLDFTAENDAFFEVVVPCILLYCLSLPSSSNGFWLTPPGLTAGYAFDVFANLIKDTIRSFIPKAQKDPKTNKLKELSEFETGVQKVFNGAVEVVNYVQGARKKISSAVGGIITGETINVRIGNFLEFTNLVVQNAVINWDMSSVNKQGCPLKATVQLTVAKQLVDTKGDALTDLYRLAEKGIKKSQPQSGIGATQWYETARNVSSDFLGF